MSANYSFPSQAHAINNSIHVSFFVRIAQVISVFGPQNGEDFPGFHATTL
jgi:hypothetical protein